MNISNRQKIRLGLAIMCVVLILFWIIDSASPLTHRLLGIISNALILLSVLLSYFDVKKHPEKDR